MTTINLLYKLKKTMYDQDENIIKETENRKRNQQKFWSGRIIELKDLREGFNIYLDKTEERVSKHRSFEVIQSEEQKEKKKE